MIVTWKEIRKKYPNAFNAFCKFINLPYKEWKFIKTEKVVTNSFSASRQGYIIEHRWLYDFFDWNRVFVMIDKIYGWNIQFEYNFRGLEFDYEIFQSALERRFKTRCQAEENAFVKAFELLEMRMTQKKITFKKGEK